MHESGVAIVTLDNILATLNKLTPTYCPLHQHFKALLVVSSSDLTLPLTQHFNHSCHDTRQHLLSNAYKDYNHTLTHLQL